MSVPCAISVPSRIWLWGVVVALAIASAYPQPLSAATATEESGYLGLPLAEALNRVGESGLVIVFTSEVVKPEMLVVIEPRQRDLRQLVDELLAPHGLRAKSGPRGALVVVRSPPPAHAGAVIAGSVHSAATLEPLAGATVTVLDSSTETRTGIDGRFEIRDIAPGSYRLEARVVGFVPETVGNLAVSEDGRPEVGFRLRPAPLVHDEIVVVPSHLTLFQEEPAAPLSLSRKDMQSLPHLSGDVFRALPLLPGVAANDVTAQIHIRGGRRDEVAILLDGQELYDAFHLKDYDSALSIVAADSLASVRLETGSFPASQGDRMGGVLDLRTKAGGGRSRTLLGLSLLIANASNTGSAADGRVDWLVSGRRGAIDLASRLLGGENPTYWDGFGRVEAVLSERHRLGLRALLSGDRFQFAEVDKDAANFLDTRYESSYFWATHNAFLGARWLAETALSSSALERNRAGGDEEEDQEFEVLDRRDLDVLGLRHSWSLELEPRRSLSWGVEARRYDSGIDYLNEAAPPISLASPQTEPRQALNRFLGDLDGKHFGGWLTGRLTTTSGWTGELGARWDRHTLTDDTLVSPRFNLARKVGRTGAVRAAWGLFHQSQRPHELQVEDGETRLFQAERSEQRLLGYERLLSERSDAPVAAIRVELYQRRIADPRPRYENLFEPFNNFPEVERDRVRIVPQRSSAEGVEVVVRGSAGPSTKWWLAYTRSRTRDRIGGDWVARSIDQPHSLGVNVARELPGRWNLAIAWHYHSGWPTTRATSVEVVDEDGESVLTLELGPLNAERLESYHRLDLRASREWQLPAGNLTFFADIQNLYRRENLSGFDPLADRELGRVQLEPERWPGVVPSIGITWEF